MAGGGYRPGAGRKRTKALRAEALEMLGAVAFGLGDGLELAGREVLHRLGLDDAAESASPADAMRAAVAGISHDNIRAGNGTRVVELFVATMERLAAQNPEGQGTKSALIEALERCPGIAVGAEQAQIDEPEPGKPVTTRLPGLGTRDLKSDGREIGPFFEPQLPLFQVADLPSLGGGGPGGGAASPSRTGRGGAATGGPGADPDRTGAGHTPLPPRPPGTPSIQGHPENFDFSGAGAGPGVLP